MERLHVVIVLAAAATVAGCVEREMTITSEPAGALVFVSDVEVGRTPLTMPFTWYGDYDIILRSDGYETLKTNADINAPLYGLPPMDLFAELAPWRIHDRRYLHFELTPLVAVSDEELIERAETLSQRSEQPAAR